MNIVAHRGYWQSGVIENSRSSVEHAIASGLKAIELDIRQNRDGEAYLLHDPYLDRVSGVRRKLRELTTAECDVVRLLDGSPLTRFWEAVDIVGTRATICLDIKEAESAHGLISALAGLRQRFEVWSPHASVVRTASRAGIPSVFISNGLHHRGIGEFLWRARDYGANGVSFFPADLEPHVIALCHHAGMPVQCGTPNDIATWRYLANHRVQTVVTDKPLECASFLELAH